MSLLRDLLLNSIQANFERRIATSGISTQNLVVEFGANHLLVDGGLLNSERPTEQSIFIALISWIVNKKIAFEAKKKLKK